MLVAGPLFLPDSHLQLSIYMSGNPGIKRKFNQTRCLFGLHWNSSSFACNFFCVYNFLDLSDTSNFKKAVWVRAMPLLMPPEHLINDLNCCEISPMADFIIVRVAYLEKQISQLQCRVADFYQSTHHLVDHLI